MNTLTAELLNFFKALSDVNRLKILGLLARESYTVEQMAEILSLKPSTISHHISKLAEVGLVSGHTESYYNLYRLEPGMLEDMARRLLSADTLQEVAAEVDVSAYDRKVISDYSLPDGRLKTIPAQRKKLEAVLHHIVRAFDPGRRYTEKEVNEILANFNDDTATLRRELVSYRLLDRDRADYWVPETTLR